MTDLNGGVQQNIICIWIWSVLAIIWKFLSAKAPSIITLQVFTFKYLTFQCFNVKNCKCHYQCAHGQVMKNLLFYIVWIVTIFYKPCKRQHALAFASHQPWDFWLSIWYWNLYANVIMKRKTSKNSIVLKRTRETS